MKIRYIFFIVIAISIISCSNRRSDPKETTKLFINYIAEKKIDKAYELLSPETKKRYSHDKGKVLQTNFQVNRYKIKKIRYRREDKEENIHYVEVVLENGDSGFIPLKKIDGKYYIYLKDSL